jgi:hypothetical protein
MRRLGQTPLPDAPAQPSLTAVSPSGMCFDSSSQAADPGALLATAVTGGSRVWWWVGGAVVGLVVLRGLLRD